MSGGRALAALIALAVALRFPTLDAQSFWRDEASTALAMDLSLGDLFRHVADLEGMPPLYMVAAWLWSKAFGAGEVGLRSLSALFGTLTVPVAFALGRELAGSRTAGLIAAALTATSPFLVWYSQEARPYALLALLTAVATLQFVRGLEEARAKVLVGWGVAAAAALATHYFAAFLIAPQAAVLLWRAPAGRRAAATGVGIVAATALALAPLVLAQRDGRVDWVSDTSLRSRATDVAKHWATGPFGTPVDVAGLLALVLLAAGLALALPRLRRAWPPAAVAAVAAVAIAGPVVLAVSGPDYVLDRYLIPALVPLFALAATGFAERPPARVAGAALAALFTAFTVSIVLDEELQREDWRTVAARLAGPPTAIVVTPDGEPPLRVYLRGARPAAPADSVSHVALVASWRFGRARPQTPAPAPGLELDRRRDLPTATIVRYRAAVPVPVDPAALAPQTLDGADPPVVLVSPGL
jgi:4-amino-4-deoxy-L-arabinose transferase-like glycosyltransferase